MAGEPRQMHECGRERRGAHAMDLWRENRRTLPRPVRCRWGRPLRPCDARGETWPGFGSTLAAIRAFKSAE